MVSFNSKKALQDAIKKQIIKLKENINDLEKKEIKYEK